YHQAKVEIGGSLRRHRWNDGNRNVAIGCFGDVYVGWRDRLRCDVTQFRIGGDDGPVDLVVQEAEQNVGLANGRGQSAMRNDPAVVGKNLDAAKCAQALQCALCNRLRDKDARFGTHLSHRTMPATPSTAHCAPSGILVVASSTPSTIGMPRSRASEARCDVEPPSSATTPETRGKIGLRAGPATRVTRTSPGATRDSSHSQFTTTARPEPQPMPAGWPFSPGCRSQISSGTIAGSICSSRDCRSLKPFSSIAHSISTGLPARASHLRSRRPRGTASPGDRHGSLTRSFGTSSGAETPCAQVSRWPLRPASPARTRPVFLPTLRPGTTPPS